MRGILLDENVPRRISFVSALPILHSSDFGESVSDTRLWQIARERELVILTKDADFSHRIMLSSPPPWIVHLRFGNLARHDYHALLARFWPAIEAMLPAQKLINVYADRLEAIK